MQPMTAEAPATTDIIGVAHEQALEHGNWLREDLQMPITARGDSR